MSEKSEKNQVKEVSGVEDELKQMQLLEARMRLQDLGEQIEERKLARERKSNVTKTRGASLAAEDKEVALKQRKCNHWKGGQGLDGLNGQGDDASDYSIIRVRMINGDVWQRCLRCKKTWRPPVKSECVDKDGTFSQSMYDAKMEEYHRALVLPTKNTMGGSGCFAYFSDGGESLREALKNTNLR